MKLVAAVFLLVTLTPFSLVVPSTPALTPMGETIVVTSPVDSSDPGSLRSALQEAQSGDTITFEPTVFPPAAPVTIFITDVLPHIHTGNLTIDASNAGVILDGTAVPGGTGPPAWKS